MTASLYGVFLLIVVCNTALSLGDQLSEWKGPLTSQFVVRKRSVKRAVPDNRVEHLHDNDSSTSVRANDVINSGTAQQVNPSTTATNSTNPVGDSSKESENKSLTIANSHGTSSSSLYPEFQASSSKFQESTVGNIENSSLSTSYTDMQSAFSTSANASLPNTDVSASGKLTNESTRTSSVPSDDNELSSVTFTKSILKSDVFDSSSAHQTTTTVRQSSVSSWASLAQGSSIPTISTTRSPSVDATSFLLPSFTLPSAFSTSHISPIVSSTLKNTPNLSPIVSSTLKETPNISNVKSSQRTANTTSSNSSSSLMEETVNPSSLLTILSSEIQGSSISDKVSSVMQRTSDVKRAVNHTVVERSVDSSVQNGSHTASIVQSFSSADAERMTLTESISPTITVATSGSTSPLLSNTQTRSSPVQTTTSLSSTLGLPSSMTGAMGSSTQIPVSRNTSSTTASSQITNSDRSTSVVSKVIASSSTSNTKASPTISSTVISQTTYTSVHTSAIPPVHDTSVTQAMAVTTSYTTSSVYPTLKPHSTSSVTAGVSKTTTHVPVDITTRTTTTPVPVDITTRFVTTAEYPEPETKTPKSEPEYTKTSPEPNDNTDDTTDPTSEPEPEPELNEEPFAEPGPDWDLAKGEWQEAWGFHVYFFGIAFTILGVYCVISLIALWRIDHLLSKHYFCSLHVLVILICFLRAIYLLIDPYNSLGTYPLAVDYFLYSTVFPCLTAVFSILFYSLLLATRVKVLSPKIQKISVLTVIISFHFCLSFTTDIIVGVSATASIMLFVCQSFFILWGLIMFIGYLILFKRLLDGAVLRQQTQARNAHERKHTIGHGFQEKPPKAKYTLGLAVKITFASAFFGVACVAFELYGMFGVYDVLTTNKPQPWPWWTYHSILRTLELLMCLSVTYVAAQPLKYTFQKHKEHKFMYLLPCHVFCSQDKLQHSFDISSGSQDNFGLSERGQIGWHPRFKHKNPSVSLAPYPPHAAEKYSDPDATLLVRKVKPPKISMLVVEDGFVRIRREDELPNNQYELDSNSRSSRSSDMNTVNPDDRDNGEMLSSINHRYSGSQVQDRQQSDNVFSNDLFHDDRRRTSDTGDPRYDYDVSDDTDIDIVVTESEHSDVDAASGGVKRTESNKSGDIFKPLSMINFAASMESELDRAFHSGNVDSLDLISHNSLPLSLEAPSSGSNDCIYNESMYDMIQSGDTNTQSEGESDPGDPGDPDSGETDTRAHTGHLTHPLVRRCKSAESKTQKSKVFEKNRYRSVSDIEDIGKPDSDDDNTGCCLTTEL